MVEWPNTRASLLARIRDARDDQAWSQFVDLYAPVVYRYARRQGLQEADAADLTQEVLRAVARSVGRQGYDPGRGSFRNWLFTLARNRVCNFRTRRKPYHHLRDLSNLGLAVHEHDITAVKIGYLEPELRDAATRALLALTPGAVNQDIPALTYRRVQRPVYPLDPEMPDTELKSRLFGPGAPSPSPFPPGRRACSTGARRSRSRSGPRRRTGAGSGGRSTGGRRGP